MIRRQGTSTGTAQRGRRLATELRRRMAGPLHTAGDAAYDRERATWSGSIDPRPLVVAEVASSDDVQAAVLAARRHGVPFAVQSTGHGTHVPCDDGLLVKTGRLRGLIVDPERGVARVGAGARWGEVIAAAAPFGLAPLAGSARDVGVAGFTLGGGVGWLSRRFGFAADSLLSADVVTADGRLLRVDSEQHPDLHWALRGGGGNFAVVTSLELRLHRVPQVVAGTVAFHRDRAGDLLAALRDGAGERPDALTATVVVGRDGVAVRAAYVGGPQSARRALAPLLDAGGRPTALDLRAGRFADMAIGGTAPRQFELLTDIPVEAILEVAEAAEAVEVRQWGGAMARAGANAGPVGHRHIPFSATVDGSAEATAPLRQHATGGAFLNFVADPTRTAAGYTPADLARLRDLKRTWDPDNLLGRTHNIAPGAPVTAAA